MRLWALVALILSVVASCLTAWVKSRWRVAKPHTYQPGPLLEVGLLHNTNYDEWVNGHAYTAPFKDLPFTPTLSCEPDVSVFMERFDWQVRPISPYSAEKGCGRMENMPWYNNTYKGDPRTVWAVPHGIDRLLAMARKHCDPSRNDRVVLFAGSEQPLEQAFGLTDAARNATMGHLRKYFNRIVYQTKDFKIEGVHLAPMGLSWGYMYSLIHDMHNKVHRSPELISREFQALVENASRVDLSYKTKGVLATRSRVATWLDDPGLWRKCVRHLSQKPVNLIYPTKTYSSVRSIMAAFNSRYNLRWFSNTTQAARAGVDFRSIPVPEWWRELPKYRFLLNPMGSAVQTAKTYEALLSLTIPIIVHQSFSAFFELARMGFPLVLISAWVEVTPENLERWWHKVSPRLESFRRNCLTVDGYWKMVTGQVAFCE